MVRFLLHNSILKIFLAFIAIISVHSAHAQYSVQMRISQWCVSGTHDCDSDIWPTTNSSDFEADIEAWDRTNNLGLGGWDNCNQEVGGNNSPGCQTGIASCNTNVTLDDRLFLDWRFRLREDDSPLGPDAEWGWNNRCLVPDFSLNDNTWRTLPGFPVTVSIADGDCSNSPVPYTVTVQWKLTGTNNAPANDLACQATAIATGGTSVNLDPLEIVTINGNNINAKDEDLCGNDEPNEDDDRTVWYKFTTGPSISSSATIRVSNNGGDNMTPDFTVYRLTGTPPTCSGYNFGNLTKVGEDDGTYLVDDDAEVTLTTCANTYLPNSTYYIQIEDEGGTLGVGYYEGNFKLVVTEGRVGNDDLCNAWIAGSSNSPGGSGAAHTESIANNDILDLGETITIPSFSNKNASAQECGSLDEPNVDNNDETVWYKVTTASNPGTAIEIDANASNGSDGTLCFFGAYATLKVYEADGSPVLPSSCSGWTTSTNWFAGIAPASGSYYGVALDLSGIGLGVIGDNSKFRIDCPKPNTTYYIQVEALGLTCDKADFTMTIKDNGVNAGPNYICTPANETVAGQNGYLGTFSSSTNVDLVINNQTTRCATVTSPGDPDNTTFLSGLNNTVWYRFRTPPADYSDGTLYHLYDVIIQRLGSSSFLTYPALYLYKESATPTGRACPDNSTDYNNLQLIGRDEIDPLAIFGNGDARLDFLCLEPNTNYYIQVDPVGGIGNSYIDFNVRVKKSAFRPADEACDALDLFPGSTIPKSKTYSLANAPLNAAPYFGLPHSNYCKSAVIGTEPNVTVGAPGGPTSNYSATGWYKFSTDANPPEWIEWDHNDYSVDGTRGTACILGAIFNSWVNIYEGYAGCAAYNQFAIQSERDLAGDGLNPASLDPGKFRLTCPKPNTTYYVQVQDASFLSLSPSTCYEGVFEPTIKTPATGTTQPINDEPCGAIFLGTVPNGGQLAPATVYDNFCATPSVGFIADQTQPLERDVWFSFIAPTSGSVLITAQSGVLAGADNDLDLQIAIWDPIMGDGTAARCADPRYLWSPNISRDHNIIDYADVPIISTTYYDILDTKNNLINEGNSLIATCLKPGKMYYVQVDGGDYFLCDLFDGGNCIQGNFKIQVKDAGLYDMASMQTAPQGNDEPCGAKELIPTAPSSPLSWMNGSNLCATAINDPVPSKWNSSDNTVWYKFDAPPEGKVRVRAEGIDQLIRRNKIDPNNTGAGTGLTISDADYHEDINLQLAVYEMGPDCRVKSTLNEIYSTYDGILTENNFGNDDDYVAIGTDGFDEYGVIRCLVPGRTYYIMLDGENDPTLGLPLFEANIEDVVGDFRISVQRFNTTLASTNDNICDAYEITGTAGMALNASITKGPFNNECASIEPGFEGAGKVAHEIEGTLFSITAKKTLWYKFKAPASGKIKIEGLNTDNDPIDLGVALYDLPNENCINAAAAYKVDDDYDPAVSPPAIDIANLRNEQITITCLEPGRYYFLQVDGANNPVMCLLSGGDCEIGEFNIRITHLPSDPTVDRVGQGNDDFCDAIDFGALNPGNNKFRNDDNNRCSSTEINEPNTNGWDFSVFDDQERTVWYRFTTGAALGLLAPGKITITVNDPSNDPCFDLDIDLYEYQGNFTTTACNNQETSNTQFNKLLRVGEGDPISLIPFTDDNRSEKIIIDCPKPSTTYFLRVNGTTTCPFFGDDQGSFDVRLEMDGISILARENDDICGSTTAPGNFGIVASGASLQKLNQNNFCATQELGEPNTTQSAVQNEPEYDETMWYHFKTSTTPGNIKVRLEAVLPLGIATVPSLTVYKEAYYNYAPCSAGFSGLIEVGSDFGSATALGGIIDFDAEVELPCPTPETDYYIQVDGYDLSLFGFTIPGYSDNFTYNLYVTDNGSGSATPVNDSLKYALPVDNVLPINGDLTSGGFLTINGHNHCAKAEDNEPRFSDIISATVNGSNTTDHDNQLEDETVWYYFTTPAKPGIINVKVEDDPAQPGSFCPNFAIFYNNGTGPTYRITGAPSSKLIQEGLESSAITGTSTNKDYACLLPNTKYYIQIDGNDLVPGRNDQSAFIVTVTDDGSGNPGPSNDLVCNSATISLVRNSSVVVNGTNLCSWEEVDEPNTSGNMGGTADDVTANDYDETVWYKFQPGWEGKVRIQLNSVVGHNFILYKSTVGSFNCTSPNWSVLTRMSSSLGSTDETFGCLDNGVWYYLQIDGIDGIGEDVGPFTLTLTHSDAVIQTNDMFCSATNFGTFTTSGAFTAANQNNLCATQELNEPNVNGDYYNINSIGYDKTLWYKFTTATLRGDYKITVTNNSPYSDRIFAGMTLYELNGTACSGVTPNWGTLRQVEQDIIPLSGGLTDGDNDLTFDCWELKTGTTYYLQVDGIDINEVGSDFNVSVQYTQEIGPLNDDVCNPTTVIVGAGAITDNNLCATTQNGELNISPSPQSSYDLGYDETMWYKFQAPAEGFVRIIGTSLASDPINLNMGLFEIKSGSSIGCPGGIPLWSNLTLVGTEDNLISNNFDYQNQCLIPGKWYMIQIDGLDLLGFDKGDYTLQVINQHIALSVPSAPSNDEPCGAIDITATIQDNPCNNGSPYYQSSYSIFDTSPDDVDRATSSVLGQGCGSRQNCSDYWYKFTVPPDSDGGIKIQGEDDYGTFGTANSTQVVAAYRVIGNPCSGGSLQLIKCDYGGNGRDSEFDFGASPGEQIYLQVFDSDEPAAPSTPQFGLCVSTRCPPKSTCSVLDNIIEYGVAQCWNLDEDGASINNNNPTYSDCLPGDNMSANYFVFNTSCGATANGYPDTVTVVFSAIDIASNTAMAIFEDSSPCDGNAQSVLVNCVPFGGCTGCSPSSNFIQTFLLDECKTYVIQILGEDDDEDGSAGQIYIFQSTLEPPILPLELLSFTGYNDSKSNVLEWTTVSETNTDRFEVEKSTDNTNFEFIGNVRASGNSSVPKSYGLVDQNPAAGINYYRLKMFDADGTYEYSKVISINTFENIVQSTGIVNIYPNPTTGKLNVVLAVNEVEATFDFGVTSIIGQIMLVEVKTLSKGLHTIEVDASSFAQGVYIVNFSNKLKGVRFERKFVKQ